jgi:hypothetical protein
MCLGSVCWNKVHLACQHYECYFLVLQEDKNNNFINFNILAHNPLIKPQLSYGILCPRKPYIFVAAMCVNVKLLRDHDKKSLFVKVFLAHKYYFCHDPIMVPCHNWVNEACSSFVANIKGWLLMYSSFPSPLELH